MTPKELALKATEILDNKKAEDIKVIEVTEQTIVADYFVLATGTSSTHVKALADDVEYAGLLPLLLPLFFDRFKVVVLHGL